jgi:Ca2+-binding EF-hand superfamily protein
LKKGYYSFCDKDLLDKEECITLSSLRMIAEELGEKISDEELKEMMVIANPDLRTNIEE